MSHAATQLDPAREEAELRAYLGDRFDLAKLRSSEALLERELERCGDEERFYRSSESYLYNLTAFAMTGTKEPYLRELTRLLAPGSRLLDYGCGIGSDGLALLEAGYRVEFADFDNPSIRYLRWRLAHRGLDAPIHDLDREVPGDFDAAYAFDVIEHVNKPGTFLNALESRARLVVINFLEPLPDETSLHHGLPIRELLVRVAGRRLRSYSIHHRRSHLVAYSPTRSGPLRRVANRMRIRAEHRRAR